MNFAFLSPNGSQTTELVLSFCRLLGWFNNACSQSLSPSQNLPFALQSNSSLIQNKALQVISSSAALVTPDFTTLTLSQERLKALAIYLQYFIIGSVRTLHIVNHSKCSLRVVVDRYKFFENLTSFSALLTERIQ